VTPTAATSPWCVDQRDGGACDRLAAVPDQAVHAGRARERDVVPA
jgi:hypothetical protein